MIVGERLACAHIRPIVETVRSNPCSVLHCVPPVMRSDIRAHERDASLPEPSTQDKKVACRTPSICPSDVLFGDDQHRVSFRIASHIHTITDRRHISVACAHSGFRSVEGECRAPGQDDDSWGRSTTAGDNIFFTSSARSIQHRRTVVRRCFGSSQSRCNHPCPCQSRRRSWAACLAVVPASMSGTQESCRSRMVPRCTSAD